MYTRIITIFCAALLLGAACFFPLPAFAGSCCGGGGGAALVLPKFYQEMVDLSFDLENYDGFWNVKHQYTRDSPGSHFLQERLNFGYARRISDQWQTSISVPYVWNDNRYNTGNSRTEGPGDSTVNVWYEAVDDQSAWKIRSLKDWTPSVKIGPSLLIPTGISPYDGVSHDEDITGRGFYRLDGNMIIAKTLHPWSASWSLGYGTYLSRPVNEEPGGSSGKYVPPYRLKPGNRFATSVALSYIYYLGSSGDTLTGTAAFSDLEEADTLRTDENGTQHVPGMQKRAVAGSLAYSSTDHDWSVRISWSHAVRENGWGKNFPTTDIYTTGVSYAFR
jgi:hypothetical protein